MVWGRRWLVVLFPILCLISGFGEMPEVHCFHISLIAGQFVQFANILDINSQSGPSGLYRVLEFYVSLLEIYISCILATTL